jgi:23S rRNA (cytidine1920-2'-O)/16S rRNA (cytidine1409-2'-O)-methyltransferase
MRADLLLVEKGLAESRAKARAAIEAGGVEADGKRVAKPSDMIAENAALTMRPAYAWVSRGGEKLAHALQVFGVDPKAKLCLDIGASTGGFSDVLLQAGAARIYAVDVGTGQLHAKLKAEPRLVSLEGRDARSLTRDDIPEDADLIVCDASFIGAAKALAQPLTFAKSGADLIVLIKPQFEAGPNAGKKGVLDEITARRAAGAAIAGLDGLHGFEVCGYCDSPIKGGDGNLELLAWFQNGPSPTRGEGQIAYSGRQTPRASVQP